MKHEKIKIIKNCKQCKKEISVIYSLRNRKNFCSRDCYNLFKKEKKILSHRGKHHTEEMKQRMKLLYEGKTFDERYGVEKAKEIKKKLVENSRNTPEYWSSHKVSENTRKKQAESKLRFPVRYWLGKTFSQGHKDKLRIARGKRKIPFNDSSIEIIKEMGIFEFPKDTIIEADGCYWHGCSECNKKPLTEKQKKQIEKDDSRTKELLEKGFNIIRLREHDIKKMNIEDFKERLK